MLLEKERNEIVSFGKKLIAAKLTVGTTGNLSILHPQEGMVAISPSGLAYFETQPEDVVVIDLDGNIREGTYRPSSESTLHLELYNLRPDIHSVIHTHSVYATTIACLGWEIPALHYVIGLAGTKVPIASYATYGTKELADSVSKTIAHYNAVLLANHGLIAVGPNIRSAFATAEAIEFAARVYYQSKCIGEPVILPDAELETVIEKFKNYGQIRVS